mgnify:CR=1 FL=1
MINATTEEPTPMLLFRDWFALLNNGVRIFAVGSSDSHTVGEPVGLDLLGPAGPREVGAEAFFVGPRQTVLLPGELLIGIRIPRPESQFGASYQRFARRRGSALAVAAVAAGVGFVEGRIVGARIALGAVAPIPLLATRAAAVLEGEAPSDELFAVAGAASAEEALPISDLRGSAAFRRELVAVLTRRALHEATSRAGIRIP